MNGVCVGSSSFLGPRTVVSTTAKTPEGFEGVTRVGSQVRVGANVQLRACTVQDDAVLGDGAIVLEGSIVEKGAQLLPGSVVPPGRIIPSKEVWGGVPARFVSEVSADDAVATALQTVAQCSEEVFEMQSVYPVDGSLHYRVAREVQEGEAFTRPGGFNSLHDDTVTR